MTTDLATVPPQNPAIALIREAADMDADSGLWSGVPMSVYLAAPGESNSSLSVLARSPQRYRMMQDGDITREPSTKDQEIGTLIHAIINEGIAPVYHLRPDVYAAADGALKPWNMNANFCKAWMAEHADKPILTSDNVAMFDAVTECVRADARAMRLISGAVGEVSARARNDNQDAPYLLRCRYDLLGHDGRGWYWVEVKTTRDASTEAFSREILKYGYHVQCAQQRRILRKITGGKTARCYLMPVEKDAEVPRVNVRQLMPTAMDIGDKILDERLALLAKCKQANQWPALPDFEPGEHIPFIDVPDYCYGDDDEISAS